MKKDEPIKYTEDLLNEDILDVDAILKSKWRHPFRVWLRYKLFIIEIFITDIFWNTIFNLRQLINKWKK